MLKKALSHEKGHLFMTDIVDKWPQGYCETLASVMDETTHSVRSVYKIYTTATTPDIYIIKTFQCALTLQEDILQMRQEFEIAQNLGLGNNHIVKPLLKKESTDPASGVIFIEILFEYGGVTLFSLMGTLKPEELLSILRQVLDALAYLEMKGVFHSDVKPQNIVVLKGIAKLIDFGVAKKFEKKTMLMKQTEHLTEKVIGQTYRYSPPEIFGGATTFIINKIDVYSWGMTFYQIISRKTDDVLANEGSNARENPTNYKNFLANVQKIRIVGDSYLLITNMIIPMLLRALAYKPEERPDFANLLAYFGHDPLTALSAPPAAILGSGLSVPSTVGQADSGMLLISLALLDRMKNELEMVKKQLAQEKDAKEKLGIVGQRSKS